ncbi:MAG: ATP-binding protein [Clostridia bacterium]|nr:ATP-binding protein [Clostridia bacterium]
MNTLKSYSCIISSDVACICKTVKEVLGYLQDAYGDMEESAVFEIKVILNELLVNAVKHGNKGLIDKCVKVNVGITKNDEVFVIVEDEGEGFEYSRSCPCERSQNAPEGIDILDETGRGIFIVKNLCERVKFNEKGNKVVVLKKISKECDRS